MEEDLPPEHVSPVELEQCASCGRRFNRDTLARHRNICTKTKKREANRKPFDMKKQRVKGTEIEAFNAMKKYSQTPAERVKQLAYERQEQKKKQWKRKHEDFIETIRTAREYDAAAKTGASVPRPEPSAPNPDYVQCPYCKRRFQEHAAERHIPFCKEQNSRIERKVTSATGGSALTKRLKYKPPLPRKRTETMEGVVSHNPPPGASLVQRKTNFSATYTVSDPDGLNQSTGNHRRRLTGTRETSSVGGTEVQKLPGSTPKIHKPHPPSRLAPPGIRSRPVHLRQLENAVQHQNAMQHHEGAYQNGLSNGYSEFDGHHQHVEDSAPPNARGRNSGGGNGGGRQSRGGGTRNGQRSESCSNSSDRSSNEEEQTQRDPFQNRRLSQRKVYPENSHSDTAILEHNRYTGHVTSTKPHLPYQASDSGVKVTNQRSKSSHLNAHGMSMSKFCYECGSKFPVPQAKYCCECGTKRI